MDTRYKEQDAGNKIMIQLKIKVKKKSEYKSQYTVNLFYKLLAYSLNRKTKKEIPAFMGMTKKVKIG